MKKLMIAAAVVCAAAMSQAASVTWSASNIYTPADNTVKVDGTTAYVFGGDYTTASIIAALEGKGATDVGTWLEGVSKKYELTTDAGKASFTTQNTIDPSTVGLTADGTKQNLYLLVFDTDGVTDASKFYVTEKEATVATSGNSSFSFGAQGNTKGYDGASQIAGNWHAVNVPEPTSGLLLLLGVAGMALRRRRA